MVLLREVCPGIYVSAASGTQARIKNLHVPSHDNSPVSLQCFPH